MYDAPGELGVRLDVPRGADAWRTLLGETVPRVIAAVTAAETDTLDKLCSQAGVSCAWIGTTDGSGRLAAILWEGR